MTHAREESCHDKHASFLPMSTDSRKTSIQLIPEPSLMFPCHPPMDLPKWASLFNYPPYLGKIEAYFQIKFSWACVNHFLRMRSSYESSEKFMDINGYDFRLPKKPEKLTQNRNLQRANDNLVAPLSIVLTQSCMNYEHWIVYQIKEEIAYLSIHVHLIKKIYALW